MKTRAIACVLVLGAAALHAQAEQRSSAPAATVAPVALTSTAHPALPRDPSRLWLAPAGPARPSPAQTRFTSGVRLHGQARYAEALPLLRSRLPDTPLAIYGEYYSGLAELRLSRLDEARATFEKIAARAPQGYVGEAARLRLAEIAELRGDVRAAAGIFRELTASKGLAEEDVLLNLARTAHAAGDVQAAAAAWSRVYYDHALTDQATLAQAQLDTLQLWPPLERGSDRFTRELDRAERLFAARRYAQARSALEPLEPLADGVTAELVSLRLAESDFYLKRYAATRDALVPWLRTATRRAEAQFFYLGAMRELGRKDEFVRLSRELVAAWPKESWAEETLNNLATHYILVSEDDSADGVFREILERYPSSHHAQRAGWRAGWRAYRQGRLEDAIRTFEQSAYRFPRSDYRPSWIYWAARAYDGLGQPDLASARYAIVVADYQNSYYGRLATALLAERGAAKAAAAVDTRARASAAEEPGPELPPTADVIRALIAAELYDDAMNELGYAQRAWGDSPAIQATLGLVHSRRGDLRRGINAMKRAYPQYMASGGEALPVEMLRVLFPVAYWDLLQRYSKMHGLDPYMIAALVAQESTFDPAIRSHANAVGLMQVLPSTGRRYARRIGVRPFRTSMLTRPETNVRLGTAIFADLANRLGGAHLALASYNAGEGAVSRWLSTRPGLPRDEFIDDIPYPETQNYVKKIVGTAEDYRRLYGELGAKGLPAGARPAVAAPSAGQGSSRATPKRTAPPKAKKAPPKKAPTAKAPAKKAAPAKKTAPARSKPKSSTGQRPAPAPSTTAKALTSGARPPG